MKGFSVLEFAVGCLVAFAVILVASLLFENLFRPRRRTNLGAVEIPTGTGKMGWKTITGVIGAFLTMLMSFGTGDGEPGGIAAGSATIFGGFSLLGLRAAIAKALEVVEKVKALIAELSRMLGEVRKDVGEVLALVRAKNTGPGGAGDGRTDRTDGTDRTVGGMFGGGSGAPPPVFEPE